MLGTILEYYNFPVEPRKEKKRHCREIESTFTSAALTTSNEHHYVPPPNLILKNFGDREDTPPRPPIVSTLEVAFTSPNPNAALHILVSLSSTLDIGPSSSDGYIHISAKAFKKLLQLIQRVDDLTMVVQ
ncbi:hypothetical protein AAG906_038479 [Vitis piasezkii]